MATAAERMKAMRARRRSRGLREMRLVVADARDASVRQRIGKQIAGLDPRSEQAALDGIEAVSEFDMPAPEQGGGMGFLGGPTCAMMF